MTNTYAVIAIREFAVEGCPAAVEGVQDTVIKITKDFEEAKRKAEELYNLSGVRTVIVVPVVFWLGKV